MTRSLPSNLFFCLCLLIGLVPASLSQTRDQQATEKQLNALKQSIGELQDWLKSAKGKRSSVQSELRRTELKIAETLRQISRVVAEIDQTRRQLARLEKQRQQLLADGKAQEAFIARQVRAAYSIGRQEYLKVLLNQEQPEQLSRTLRYYDYFNRARSEQIEAYSATIRQLSETEIEIAEEQQRLTAARTQLEKRRKTLGQDKQQRQQVLVKLEGNIKNRDQELKKLLADRARLQELLEAVEQTVAELELPDASVPITQLKGKLPWPADGRIARRFGSRDANARTRWNGVLINATEGHDVKAIHYGRVVFSDWLRGFGLLVILDHGNGYMSLYGHNQTLYRATGDWVNPGEVIAGVGNSGGQQRTGLYFEIRRNGTPVDPQKWILARK